MRRILTTLMILLAVIVAGLTSLVLLVNPNDFRAYMVHEVAERSGYQLDLDGPLRDVYKRQGERGDGRPAHRQSGGWLGRTAGGGARLCFVPDARGPVPGRSAGA